MTNQTIRLRIAGSTPIHGKRPGAEFTVAVDADGIPLDQNWRRRLADENLYGIGAVVVVGASPATPTPVPAATSSAAPATAAPAATSTVKGS